MDSTSGEKTRVFISQAQNDTDFLVTQLSSTLERAGMSVLSGKSNGTAIGDRMEVIKQQVATANCSVHVLSSVYGERLPNDTDLSLARYEFDLASKRLAEDPNFKIFIWYPPDLISAEKEPEQESFIHFLRNNLKQNMVFTNISSAIQFADDIRSMTVKEEQTSFDVKSTDIFLVFNELDEGQADEIIDLLSDIVDVEKLNIVQDSDMDYSAFCVEQIGQCRLAVVYFKDTADWALPFAQQVWKKAGGASLKAPILLIGDEDPEENINKRFNAPKVISLIVAGELIPLEIKVQLDKVTEA